MNDRVVIVIGVSHHNTLSIVRALGIEHFKPIVLLYGCRKSYIAKSKYICKVDYFNSVDEIIDFLKGNYNSFEVKPVIISCTDEISHKLDLYHDVLLQHYDFFHTKEQGHLTANMDKQTQTKLASMCGFSVPWSIKYSTNLDSCQINYPCILKPVASINGGKHISICDSVDSFKRSVLEFNNIDFLVQEFINKEQEIVILGLTVNGKTTIPAFIDKYREIDGGTTYSRVYNISKIPSSIIDASVKMINHIEYEGLWGLECIVSNNNYYFLELNLRNDATTYASTIAGVNLPYMYVAEKSSVDYIVPNSIQEIYSIVEHNDLIYTIKNRKSVLEWIKDLKQAHCKYIYDKDDIKPLLHLIVEYLNNGIKKLFRITK